MGTVDRIVDGLKKSRSDKITLIDSRYDEHKAWMAEEFQNVRNLIAQNSKRGKKAPVAAKTAYSAVSKAVPLAVASSSSIRSARQIATSADPQAVKAAQRAAPTEVVAPKLVKSETRVTEEVKKNKRKSPEEALQPEKLSPEAKRNSSDFEKIVLQAGLPSDLNRLKKDNLLKELAARGHFDLSMKSLKKDMVEALKSVLMEQGKASPEKVEAVEPEYEEEHVVEQVSESSQSLREFNKTSPSNKAAVIPASASARKGSSTMSDIRKEFNSSGNMNVAVETEEERKRRTEEEFKRRLSHTQARKSEGKVSVADTSDSNAANEAREEPSKATTPPPAPSSDRDSDIMISDDGSTWMEVASPQPMHSLANLKTNIAKETSAMTTPSHKGAAPVFIKQEKGTSPDTGTGAASAVKANATMPESATKLSKTQSHWERLTSASAATQEVSSASAVAAAALPPAPTPGKDSSATQASSAVKSSAKKGLFSFLSAKVKEEKVDPPALAPDSAVPSTPHAKSQAPATGPSSALRSGSKKAQMQQQSEERVLQPVQQVSKSPQQQGADEYKIEDREDSGGSDSGTDDEDENKSKQNRIPEWARGVQLKEQLERQYGLHGHASVDPDLIFPEVVSCSLEEIFGASMGKSGSYNKRSSSAHWDADELTLVEKRTYRAQMGLSVN